MVFDGFRVCVVGEYQLLFTDVKIVVVDYIVLDVLTWDECYISQPSACKDHVHTYCTHRYYAYECILYIEILCISMHSVHRGIMHIKTICTYRYYAYQDHLFIEILCISRPSVHIDIMHIKTICT